MNYYIDIKIKPNKSNQQNVLLNDLYTKFHHVLSLNKTTNIGVSFPNHNLVLGTIFRIHGNESELAIFAEDGWFGELISRCVIGKVLPVPNDVVYRTISRKQSNMTAAKLRRLIKRNHISPEEVKAYKLKMLGCGMDDPYVDLVSASTGERYRRYIVFGEKTKNPTAGSFDTFGLSKIATIPWF